jgi:succinyl-CoA synthetase alpha subunit
MIVRGAERVLVQGITGRQGTFWSERMLAYGTRVVGGVNPKRAGETCCGVPVFESAEAAMAAAPFEVSVMFIPPLDVKAAALDALAAGCRKLVVLTEHIPLHDTAYVLAAAREADARVIGPNTAGLVTPGECFVGFMPAFNPRVFAAGTVGVVSRSGSLGTLACLEVVRAGLGISAFIGIGGDPLLGTTTRDVLIQLDRDPRTAAVVLIGEIGGVMEEEAADYAAGMSKPVAAFIAGSAAPPDRKMGHAGAIVTGGRGSHAAKRRALEAAGVSVLATPSGLGRVLREQLEGG